MGPAGLGNLESIRPKDLAPAGIQIPDRSACSLVTILTINPTTHSFIYRLIYGLHNDVGKRSDYMYVVSNGRIIGLVNSALAWILEWMWPNLRFKTGSFLNDRGKPQNSQSEWHASTPRLESGPSRYKPVVQVLVTRSPSSVPSSL